MTLYDELNYKSWMHDRKITPTEKQLDEEIAAGFYDGNYDNELFPFFENEGEDDYGDESNP